MITKVASTNGNEPLVIEYPKEYLTHPVTIMSPIEPLIKVKKGFDGMFFAVGRATCGGRFYSETVNDYESAIKLFKKYIGTIEYFGGGEVELFCINDDGYDIIIKTKI